MPFSNQLLQGNYGPSNGQSTASPVPGDNTKDRVYRTAAVLVEDVEAWTSFQDSFKATGKKNIGISKPEGEAEKSSSRAVLCLLTNYYRTPRLITGKTGHFPRYWSGRGEEGHKTSEEEIRLADGLRRSHVAVKSSKWVIAFCAPQPLDGPLVKWTSSNSTFPKSIFKLVCVNWVSKYVGIAKVQKWHGHWTVD